MSLPEGWTMRTLAEVVTLQRGFDLPHHARRDGPFPVLTSGETGGFHDEGPVKGPGLIVGRATNLGRPRWSDGDFWPHNTTMYAKDFRGNSPRWVFHLFENTDLSGYDSGSVQPMLNRNYIAQVPVVVPPLDEQRAIAEVLGALDDKIAANTKLATTTNDYLRELLQLYVSKSTEMGVLAQIASINSIGIKPMTDGNLRYVDIASVSDGEFRLPPPTSWEGAPSRARRKLQKGDTIWSTVRPNRRSHALNLYDGDDLVGSTGLAVLSPKTVGWAYLYEVSNRSDFTDYLENVAEGSAYPAVRAEMFAGAPVPLIDEARRDQFEETASSLRLHLHSLEQENRSLAELRDTLLPQLMSGALRVRDAEAIVEEVV